jgi:hypothetical protein
MNFNAGDKVVLLAPFNVAFPGEYAIIGPAVTDDTYKVDIWYDGVGSDFHEMYLEAVDGNINA